MDQLPRGSRAAQSSVRDLECGDRLVGVVAHQQRRLAVGHVEGNGAANPLAGVEGARLQHGISGALNRGLEESAGLVEDLEVVWVIVDRAGRAGQFHLDPEVATRGRWHLPGGQPRVPEQDQLAASFARGELNPIALSGDLRNWLLLLTGALT